MRTTEQLAHANQWNPHACASQDGASSWEGNQPWQGQNINSASLLRLLS